MRFILYILILMFLGNCRSQKEQESQTVLVTGGSIITMSEAGVVEAMVIQDGRVSAVGSRKELQSIFPKATLYNLNNSTTIPGFIDSHTHVREMGEDRLKADLTGVASVEEMVARLKDFFGNSQPGTWLIGQGWDKGVWGSKGYPDRQVLDEAFPNNPVALESLHGFGGFYNGKALELAEINAQTPDPQVGTILRRPDGSPSGVMLTTAQALINKHIPPPDLDDVKAAIIAGLQAMARAGVTSVHEAGKPVGGWYEEQCLDTATALKAMTRSGAFAAFQDGQTGSLTPGALADFIELDRNPLLLEKGQLKDLQVLKTWVGGRLIEVPSN